MKLTIICAMASNRVIGKDNRIPWHLPDELDFFKKETMGGTLIMGRRTHESIGRPLPGRRNIVLTRREDGFAGCETASSLAQALEMCKEDVDVYVIGGAKVYEQSLAMADIIILTVLDRAVDGDTLFPDLTGFPFVEVSRRRVEGKECYTTFTYHRLQ